MIKVRRANVELDITEEELDKYFNLGYSVIDDFGNVIKEAIPTDLAFLQSKYVEYTQKIDELEAKIKSLETQLANSKVKTNEIKKVSKKAVEIA